MRKDLGLSPPLEVKDTDGAKVCVVLLPRNAVSKTFGGILCFEEPPDDSDAGNTAAVHAKATHSTAADAKAHLAPVPVKAKLPVAQTEVQVQGKTIGQWEAEQATLFPGERQLPPDWLRIKSRSHGKVYFYHKHTQEATYDFPEPPLPKGWTKEVSKSTGKTYYFHAGRKESTFVRPKG